MAVKIRLKRMGKIRAPFYRIVVADSRTKRDGRVIEEIGKYNPKLEPSLIEVDSERAQHWLSEGAQPSEPVLALLRKTGDWQKFKGEPAPAPLKEQAPRRVKLDVFNEALREAHGSDAPEAVTTKTRKKSDGDPAVRPAARTPQSPAETPQSPAETKVEQSAADAAQTEGSSGDGAVAKVVAGVIAGVVAGVAGSRADDSADDSTQDPTHVSTEDSTGDVTDDPTTPASAAPTTDDDDAADADADADAADAETKTED